MTKRLHKCDLPTLSVVIPCWNAAESVGRAIQSVINQSYPYIEIILVDDGSTDHSLGVIKSFGDKILWRSGPNSGAPVARNLGLRLATAEYVLFLDADDYIEGPYLESLAQAAAERPDIIFGPQFIEDATGAVSARQPAFLPSTRREALELWIADTVAQTGAMMWNVSFLRILGGWDETLVRNQDVELGLRGLLASTSIAVARSGKAVWCQHNSPNRISHTHTGASAALGVLRYLDEHLAALQINLSEGGLLELAVRYYETARWLFQSGQFEAGRLALARSRKLGYRGHKGEWMGRQISMLFGLETRERLGRIKRGLIMRQRTM